MLTKETTQKVAGRLAAPASEAGGYSLKNTFASDSGRDQCTYFQNGRQLSVEQIL